MRNPHRYFSQSLTRRLISLAVAAAFTLTILPIPLPVIPQNRNSKDTSQPFPCQNRTCGCCSADQCWKKCCCFTNQQKVAWARKNRVELPRFVVDAARNEAQERSQNELTAETKAALETEICSLTDDLHLETQESITPANTDQQRAESMPEKSVPQQPSSQGHPLLTWLWGLAGVDRNDAEQHWSQLFVAVSERVQSQVLPQLERIAAEECLSDEGTASVRSDYQLVLIIKALECRGQGSQWIVCAPVAMPSPVSITATADNAVTFLPETSERLPVGSLQPPVPPPRIS